MSVEKLLKLITKLEATIPSWKKLNPHVSAVSVGWHIEHILMATVVITEQLIQSDPTTYSWRFNKNRFIVFSLNRIPRGKGNAPRVVQPNEKISEARIKKYVEIAVAKINALNRLPPSSNFLHPYLGKLNVAAAIRFMCIHLKHHLGIIHDIMEG